LEAFSFTMPQSANGVTFLRLC